MLAVSKAEDPIDCREAELLLHRRVDGEVGPADTVELDIHLSQCDGCRRQLQLFEKTRASLRAQEETEVVPAGLLARIREQTVDAPVPSVPAVAAPPPPRKPLWAAALALGVFGVMAIAAVVGLGLQSNTTKSAAASSSSSEGDPVVASVATHAMDVPVDVASPDPKVVEAFLRPRLGQLVNVPQLDQHGFGLRGGRVVAVQQQRAAQLVYDTSLGKRMTVLIVPDRAGTLARQYRRPVTGRPPAHQVSRSVTEVHRAQQRGYAVRVLTQGHMLYAVVDADGKGAAAVSNALENDPAPAEFEPVDAVTGRR